MIALPFDTLVYTHKLMDTGMPREQAEKVAETQKEIFEAQNQHVQETLDKAISTHIATKEDLLNVNSNLKGDISNLKEDMLNLKYELKQDIANLDKKIDTKTIYLEKKIDLLRKEFEGKFNLIYWMLGFSLAISVSILFKLYF